MWYQLEKCRVKEAILVARGWMVIGPLGFLFLLLWVPAANSQIRFVMSAHQTWCYCHALPQETLRQGWPWLPGRLLMSYSGPTACFLYMTFPALTLRSERRHWNFLLTNVQACMSSAPGHL